MLAGVLVFPPHEFRDPKALAQFPNAFAEGALIHWLALVRLPLCRARKEISFLALHSGQVRLTHMQCHRLGLFRAAPARPAFVVYLVSRSRRSGLLSIARAVMKLMEYKREQARARLSSVPAIGLHADSILHATSVQVR